MRFVDVVLGGIRSIFWIGVALLGVGVYMLLSLFIPGLSLIGSIVILAIGLLLLARYFSGRRGGWALYTGALLTAVGAAHVVDQFAIVPRNGPTAIAIGIAFLGIAWVRRRSGRGGGWESNVGMIALLLGLLEIAVGTSQETVATTGSPSLLDLLLPVVLIVLGAMIVTRTFGLSRVVGRATSIRR